MGVRQVRAGWALPLLLAAALVAPNSAAAAGRQAPAAGGQRWLEEVSARVPADAQVWVNRDGDVERRNGLTDVVLGVEHYRDRGVWLDAAAEVVERATGAQVASASPELDAEGPTGTVIRGVPAGDLDGDGLDDVVTLTYDLADEAVLMQARRGTDATVLWERRSEGDGALLWPLGSDADGDGVDDLSVEGLRITSEKVVEECEDFDGEQWCWPVEYHATFTWTLGVASGATGETLWTREDAGQVDEVYSESAGGDAAVGEYSGRYELHSTNLYVFGLPAGDLTGRGGQDMVVDAVDLDVVENYSETDVAVAWLYDGSLQVRARTRADVLDASSGEVRERLTDTANGRISFLSPVPDSVGGPGPDLMWDRTVVPDQEYQCLAVDVVIDDVRACPDEAEGGWAVAVDLIDGQSLAPAWSATVPDGWIAFSLHDDLDGDERAELLVLSDSPEGYTTTLLSGATGAALWTHTSRDDWLFPSVIAPLDAVAGNDLVTVLVDWNSEDSVAIVIERRSGVTGKVISSTRHALPPHADGANMRSTLIYAAGSSDGDGDGVGDLTFGWVQESYRYGDDDEMEMLDIQSSGTAESGRSGIARRRLSKPGQAALLLPIDDLDGDGLTDTVEDQYSYDSQTDLETFDWTAAPFGPGPDMWRTSATADYVTMDTAGDQDGRPGNEVLVTSYFSDADSYSSSVASLSGRTATQRWALSTR